MTLSPSSQHYTHLHSYYTFVIIQLFYSIWQLLVMTEEYNSLLVNDIDTSLKNKRSHHVINTRSHIEKRVKVLLLNILLLNISFSIFFSDFQLTKSSKSKYLSSLGWKSRKCISLHRMDLLKVTLLSHILHKHHHIIWFLSYVFSPREAAMTLQTPGIEGHAQLILWLGVEVKWWLDLMKNLL